jgi:uroporphyrinogen-III decarboxylase
MTSRALMRAAMLREPTERIPTMPQIWHDLPLRLDAGDGEDWIDGLARCIEQPALIDAAVIRLARATACDGIRLFTHPRPMKVARRGDTLIVLDQRTGERTGRIDVMGGGAFVPDTPAPPVSGLAEARERLEVIGSELTPDCESVTALRRARETVPDLFVVSAPGGITINTYMTLRGNEQALVDLAEEPALVSAVLMLQAEAMVRRAEALLTAGIDALYIGDAAASASVISPRHFERYCLPAYRAFCDHFRPRGVLMYIHVCGDSRPILEMLADTGVHTVEPLDPMGGVSVADAKARIGARVSLMGGVSTNVLARGTPAEVRAEAERVCREGGPRGYILAAGDMVPPVTPLANLRAMTEVARTSSWKNSTGYRGRNPRGTVEGELHGVPWKGA